MDAACEEAPSVFNSQLKCQISTDHVNSAYDLLATSAGSVCVFGSMCDLQPYFVPYTCRFARFLPPVCNCKGNHASDPDWSCLVASEIKWVSQLWQLVWSNRFHPAKKYWIIGWQPWNISLASTQLTHKNSLSVDSIVTYSKTVDDDIVFVSLQTSNKQKDVGVAVK